MSFFGNQDRARRRTGLLVVLFVMAVAMILFAVTGLVYLVIVSQTDPQPFPQWLQSPQGLLTGAGILVLIASGSLFRYLSLRGGGEQVAKMVKARPIAPDSNDPDERRLRHVTEEMAIASGVTMPQLYVMDREEGINAFVAGYQANEAVLVVTRGTLTQLNRDELQGVVGHEFSHILNGDMRINVRLIALLSGILLIGQFGQVLLRGGIYSSMGRSNRGGGGNNRGAAVAIGLALMAVGYIGLFFGRLIKSAISRQREFLADAASVQFTRQPEGIAGALYKIHRNQQGSYLLHTQHAEDMTHLCFGQSIPLSFSRFMASHPPIEERITAIDPSLLARMRARYGRRPPAGATGNPGATAAPAGTSSLAGGSSLGGGSQGSSQPGPETRAEWIRRNAPSDGFSSSDFKGGNHQDNAQRTHPVSAPLSTQTGTVTLAGEEYARKLLRALPEDFYDLIHQPAGAAHLCYALVLAPQSGEHRQQGTEILAPLGNMAVDRDTLNSLLTTLDELGESIHLPCLELALAGLRTLDTNQRQALIQQVETIAALNGRTSLYEFALIGFLRKHLSAKAGHATPTRYHRYQPVLPALRQLMWLMARATVAGDPVLSATEQSTPAPTEAVMERYRLAMGGFENPPKVPENTTISARDLGRSLQRLAQLSPMLKPAVIDACGDCILSNGHISLREYELLRVVADQLDCPMPPLVMA
ncbi:MAG: peptidase M48 [Halomonadaceae bacterium]|nr:MAG: peptidase M48 [Halomonadaceae bacterium]